VVVLAVLLPSTVWCIPHLGVSYTDRNSSRIVAIAQNSNCGNSSSNGCNSSSTMLLLHRCSRLHQATTAVSRWQLFMLQLQKDGALFSRMPLAQEKQFTVRFDTRGQSVEGPTKGSCTMDWPHQLHYHGRDSHGRRSASRYVLPQ
jgi:hypothetical protein